MIDDTGGDWGCGVAKRYDEAREKYIREGLWLDTYDETPVTAMGMLDKAAYEMSERAKTYDNPEGERSMGATVAAFSAITGVQMSEQQGWQFMEVLKMVRSNQGEFRADSFIDGAAYAALAGEAASRE